MTKEELPDYKRQSKIDEKQGKNLKNLGRAIKMLQIQGRDLVVDDLLKITSTH